MGGDEQKKRAREAEDPSREPKRRAENGNDDIEEAKERVALKPAADAESDPVLKNGVAQGNSGRNGEGGKGSALDATVETTKAPVATPKESFGSGLAATSNRVEEAGAAQEPENQKDSKDSFKVSPSLSNSGAVADEASVIFGDEGEEEEELTVFVDFKLLQNKCSSLSGLPEIRVQRGYRHDTLRVSVGEFDLEGEVEPSLGSIAIFEKDTDARACRFVAATDTSAVLSTLSNQAPAFPTLRVPLKSEGVPVESTHSI